jgi:leucyl-tRNA synthetase
MLAPLAPHIAEELWSRLGHSESLTWTDFPVADEALLVDETIDVPVQINGKMRAVVSMAAGLESDAVEAAARADDRIAGLLDGKEIRRVIVVPGRSVNFVV